VPSDIVCTTARVESGLYIGVATRDDGHRYEAEPVESQDEALTLARAWAEWHTGAPEGKVESIYYILAVPETWAGPPPGAHLYSGLRVKIGLAKDVRRRLENLRTGTPEKLIVHALEPGSRQVERQRHGQFSQDRRQGEWFVCSPALTRHMWDAWRRHRLLHPEDAAQIAELVLERIPILRGVRETMGGPPDLVNPALDDDWRGKKVFMDLVYANPLVPRKKVKRYTDFEILPP